MWQEIIVYGIGVAALLYIIYQVAAFIRSLKEPAVSPCAGCKGCGITPQPPKGGAKMGGCLK